MSLYRHALSIIVTWAVLVELAVGVEVKGCPVEVFGSTSILVCGPQTIRVWRGDKGPPSDSLMVSRNFTPPSYTKGVDSILTKSLSVHIDSATELVTITNVVLGLVELQESTHKVSSLGNGTFQVFQSFELQPGELLYGGGQVINCNNIDITNVPMRLHHSTATSPISYFASSLGYGILWDSNAVTTVNENATIAFDTNGEHHFNTSIRGRHSFEIVINKHPLSQSVLSLTLICSDRQPQSIIYWNSTAAMPPSISGRSSPIEGGSSCKVILTTQPQQPVTVYYNQPGHSSKLSLRANMSSGLSYYYHGGFVTPGMSSAVVGNQFLTGVTPKQPLWSLGYIQSKTSYRSQQELLKSLSTHRSLGIPIDSIVQGMGYWGSHNEWGPQWNPTTYPNPEGMSSAVHDQHARLVVNSWVNYSQSSTFATSLRGIDGFLPNTTFYDPFNDAARNLSASFVATNIKNIGADCIWLDGNSPFGVGDLPRTHLGPGYLFSNAYPLESVDALKNTAAGNKRNLVLTSAGFTGIQRSGGCLLGINGDSNWDTLRQDIIMSLAVQSSGLPCWSSTVGGYNRRGITSLLLVRWFQFAVFTPMVRNHGLGDNEIWIYGNETVSQIIQSALSLRYQLMPYTYSSVIEQAKPLQRPLTFDYVDSEVAALTDQFMFGLSLLVAPMTSASNTRQVYLPFNFGGWYDFHTGKYNFPQGWSTITSPINEVPLYVIGGSVIVTDGIPRQHTVACSEVLEVRVYIGNPGSCSFYEDDGETTNGGTLIYFDWSDSADILRVSERSGTPFNGMLTNRTLHIVFVREGHGIGPTPTQNPDRIVAYNGTAISISRY
eukprot:TRINITY_DN18049_c0_g1_i1.p1 TRINITY_DN18049_c0_g1~~TRINITY_DN18049_c0_g1_i1.p1  ORF type:complete len:831 (+),score=119.37 TRINITY_DN18049_c0_g1_i1:55-2547(+)